MELIKENTTRKVDSLGRVSIPKGIRNRNNVNVNDELEFYTLRDHGKEYICCAKVQNDDEINKYELVVNYMQELGLEVPAELLEKV